MEDLGRKNASERSIGKAIRAIEMQAQTGETGESTKMPDQRRKFFEILDNVSDQVFARIEAAALSGKREFYLGTVPGFKDRCDEIFGFGLGTFPKGLVNDWLRARDLKHIFHSETSAITW